MTNSTRGPERERILEQNIYYSDAYFSMPQLCSFAHQLNYIHSMRPTSVIEIGMGNGFISSFLRRSGIQVTTADINPALEPDICAPLRDVQASIDQPADVVICCEVLEHMPLDSLDENLNHLRKLGDRLFLTLPNSRRTWGFSGLLHLPKLKGRTFTFTLDTPWKRPLDETEHFWEVGYTEECSRRTITAKLKSRYRTVRSGRFALNPYHIYFICE